MFLHRRFFYIWTMFRILIIHDRKRYEFNVEKLPSDAAFDYYKVIGRNKSIILKNNAPILRRNNLKSRRPTWQVHSGEIWNKIFTEEIVKAIEKYGKD